MTTSALVIRESEATLARGSKSFNLAGRFLPTSRRLDAAVVYALCRHIDDLADERTSDAGAKDGLAAVERELKLEAAPSPLVQAFLGVAERRGISVRHALDLIAGVRSDVGPVRLEDDAELHRYGYLVAGTVGLMMCGVIGVHEEAAHKHAIDLGIAMQITNICRDVAEDARANRVYLPAERLRAHGVDPNDLAFGREVNLRAIAAVVDDLLDRAEALYVSADFGMRYIPFIPRAAIMVASRAYREIGRRLRRHGSNPMVGRTIVPRGRKLVVASLALTSLLRPRVLGLVSRPHDPLLHHGCRPGVPT